jgi:hypothetical protein
LNIVAIIKFDGLFFSEDRKLFYGFNNKDKVQKQRLELRFRYSGDSQLFSACLVTFWTPYMSLEDNLQQRNKQVDKEFFVRKRLKIWPPSAPITITNSKLSLRLW